MKAASEQEEVQALCLSHVSVCITCLVQTLSCAELLVLTLPVQAIHRIIATSSSLVQTLACENLVLCKPSLVQTLTCEKPYTASSTHLLPTFGSLNAWSVATLWQAYATMSHVSVCLTCLLV